MTADGDLHPTIECLEDVGPPAEYCGDRVEANHTCPHEDLTLSATMESRSGTEVYGCSIGCLSLDASCTNSTVTAAEVEAKIAWCENKVESGEVCGTWPSRQRLMPCDKEYERSVV